MTSVDLNNLTRRWELMWPECPPVGYLLRHCWPDRWVRSVDPDDPDVIRDVYVCERQYELGSLDEFLRLVADDQMGSVIVAPTTLEWLYHPYDGGADVMLASTWDRDRLAARHANWLSSRPDGL